MVPSGALVNWCMQIRHGGEVLKMEKEQKHNLGAKTLTEVQRCAFELMVAGLSSAMRWEKKRSQFEVFLEIV